MSDIAAGPGSKSPGHPIRPEITACTGRRWRHSSLASSNRAGSAPLARFFRLFSSIERCVHRLPMARLSTLSRGRLNAIAGIAGLIGGIAGHSALTPRIRPGPQPSSPIAVGYLLQLSGGFARHTHAAPNWRCTTGRSGRQHSGRILGCATGLGSNAPLAISLALGPIIGLPAQRTILHHGCCARFLMRDTCSVADCWFWRPL